MTQNSNDMDNLLFGDFESASHTDLLADGLGRYLADPSTIATCFTFRLPGMNATDLWERGAPFPKSIVKHIESGGLFVAHNASFDLNLWNEVLRRELPEIPALKDSQVRCSAVRARYNGLPGSLENACRALGLSVQKDMEGSTVMKTLAPHPEWTPGTHPDLYAKLFKYAIIDTDAMIGLWNATLPIPHELQQEYEADLRINRRGFGVDIVAAKAMEEIKEHAELLLDYQITMATQGGILAVSEVQKIKEYVKNFTEDLPDLARETLKKFVTREGLPSELKDVLSLRLDASRAPKKSAAILRAHVNERMQHSRVFYGALTGRSTARGCGNVQLLNVARPRPGRSSEDCERYLEAIKVKDIAFLSQKDVGPVLAALADAQRPLFRATREDQVLVDADLSGIEARMAPWLANAEPLLQEFESGIDGYKVEASGIFGIPYDSIDKDQRQIGKVVRLAWQFGGGEGALDNMAANYGVVIDPDKKAGMLWVYRATKPEYEAWWAASEFAALAALDQPGRLIEMPAGRGFCSKITYLRDDRALRMTLPSGRVVSYHNARLQLEVGASAPVAIYDKPEGYIERLDRNVLSNNQTQAEARNLLWEIIVDVDSIEDIVHEVYDQIVLEVPRERAELRLSQLIERMKQPPKWAPGLPLDAEGYTHIQWRK